MEVEIGAMSTIQTSTDRVDMKNFDLIARHIVAVKDLGAPDRLFGGVMLAWLDEAGAAYAKIQARVAHLVTRHIEEMELSSAGAGR